MFAEKALLLVSIALITNVPVSGQRQSGGQLRLEAIRALVENRTPDEAIAGEIASRGLVSPPDDDWIADLQTRGAGAHTVSVLRALVPVGTLTINMSVANAYVSIDGASVGNSGAANNLVVPNVRFGKHQVLVREDRYLDAAVEITTRTIESSVLVTLVPSIGFLVLTPDAAGATISVSGSGQYTGEIRGLGLPAGDYTASVTAPGHRPAEVRFSIVPGRTTTATVDLVPVVSELVSAMTLALSEKDYSLAASEAHELLKVMPNGYAYLTLSQVAFNAGNVNEFFENARRALQQRVDLVFNMVHVDDKRGAHPVTMRLGYDNIRFDVRGARQCQIPASVFMWNGLSPPPDGRKHPLPKGQVQGAKEARDKLGRPVLELRLAGHTYQLADVQSIPGAVQSRDEYRVIRALLSHASSLNSF